MDSKTDEHVNPPPYALTLLQTRLQPPSLPADITARLRLNLLVQRGVERKLLLVIAPAGYGKTTAVLCWMQQQSQPAAWLSLDAATDDLNRFVAYIVAAVQRVAPDVCTRAETLVHGGQAPAAVLLAALVNDLAGLTQRIVFVLDDYDNVSADAVHEFMAALIDALPPTICVIMTCRANPLLPLARARRPGGNPRRRSAQRRDRDTCTAVGDDRCTAASIVVAARNAGLGEKHAHTAVTLATQAYRTKLADFAGASYLGVWYSHTTTSTLLELADKRERKAMQGRIARVQTKDRLAAFAKLTEVVDGERRIVHNPPLIVRLDRSEEQLRTWLNAPVAAYTASLDDSRQRLLGRYRLVDVAHKVVGVGSVGTRCFITYWEGIDEGDPLFLQVKQANPSLLEPYLGRSEYAHPGERVATGQRLMQATHDIFLGYTHSGGHDFFVRQLYDMKGSADLSRVSASYLERYAALCGAVLARAHARTGDAAEIAGYLGKSDRFDAALVEFAVRYADQNDADYALFKEAIADGRIEAQMEEPTGKASSGKRRP